MFEIEIKSYCDNLDDLKDRLAAGGAKFLNSEIEADTYFNHPAKDFKITDEALRIRRAGSRCFMTYKGPKLDIKAKTRYEKELEISDGDALREILIRLGFIEVNDIIKNRETYDYNGILICLDRVQGLGDFVELEKIGDDIKNTQDMLFKIAGQLGLSRFERRSYLELKMEKK